MRTKFLLTAMALPVLFAACTNDELDVIGNENVAQVERRVVEDVVLNFGLDGDADSRLAYNGSYKWQKNDEIGACLMDVIVQDKYDTYQWGGATWAEAFDFTSHIHTNYKFTLNSSNLWTTDAKMCEGNYFYYYPYDANAGLRNAYYLERVNQTLANTTSAALKDAYVENNAFVGYSKVGHGDNAGETLDITMVPVFGATGITIKNTGTDTYKIEKIVLRGNSVFNKATINPTTCTKEIQYSSRQDGYFVEEGQGLVKEESFNVAQYVKSSAEAYYSWENPAKNKSYDAEWSGYNKVNALKDVLDYVNAGDLQVVIASGNTVRPQGEINVIAMLRPMDVKVAQYSGAGSWEDGQEIILDIHTDKGLIRDIKLNYHYTSTNGSMEDDASITNVLTDKALTKLGDGKSIKVTFDDTSLDTPKEMVINKNDELANLIHWNAASSAPIKANLKSNVTITKAMYNELAASQITTATLYGGNSSTYSVTIAADVPAGALDRFTFENISEVKVLGTQTLAKGKTVPVAVNAGATLNVTGNVGFVGITNKGIMNINSNLSTAYSYDANGDIDEYSKIVNTENGVINVATGKQLTAAVELTNAYCHNGCVATINNQGTIRHLINNRLVNNTGTIGTEAQVGSISELASNTDTGTIHNNNGKVFLNTNNGSVYANGTSTTRMNENNMYIIITKLDEDNGNFLAETMGYIVQEIAEPTNTDGVDVRANMLWLSSTLKVEKKDANGNYVDVNLNQGALNGQVQVVATSANARIDGNNKKLTMSHITVRDGAKLVLNKINVFNYVKDGGHAWVYMEGNNSVSTITVNNNASLTTNVDNGCITVSKENAKNVIDNNSSSTTFGVYDDYGFNN